MRAIARNQANSDLVPLGDWGPQDSSFRTDLWPLRGSITWDIRFHSVDTNGNINPYVAGVTPVVTGLVVSAQTAGAMKGGRMNPATLGAGLNVVSGVLRVPVDGITETLILNSSVTNQKIDRVTSHKLLVVDSDMVSCAVNKLLAGTCTVAVAFTAPDITVTSTGGTVTIKINPTDKFKITDSATGTTQTLNGVSYSAVDSANSVIVATAFIQFGTSTQFFNTGLKLYGGGVGGERLRIDTTIAGGFTSSGGSTPATVSKYMWVTVDGVSYKIALF
jgi:hypothetical protein